MEPMKGKCASSRVDLWYTEVFCIPEVTAVFLSSYDSFLRTLWCFSKHTVAPYVFGWEHGIALHPMNQIRPSSSREGEVSFVFSSCGRNLGYILELRRGWPFLTPVSLTA